MNWILGNFHKIFSLLNTMPFIFTSSFYAQLRKEEEERQEEWAKKYRDRAKERRDGQNPDYEVSSDTLPATSGYRAVGPNLEP